MTRTCGCTDDHPFPAKCARARELEADLRQAIREKDWHRFRDLGEQLTAPHTPAAPAGKVAKLSANGQGAKR